MENDVKVHLDEFTKQLEQTYNHANQAISEFKKSEAGHTLIDQNVSENPNITTGRMFLDTTKEKILTDLVNMLTSPRLNVTILRDGKEHIFKFRELTDVDETRKHDLVTEFMKTKKFELYTNQTIKESAVISYERIVILHLASSNTINTVNTQEIKDNEPVYSIATLMLLSNSVILELYNAYVEWCNSLIPMKNYTEMEVKELIDAIKKLTPSERMIALHQQSVNALRNMLSMYIYEDVI